MFGDKSVASEHVITTVTKHASNSAQAATLHTSVFTHTVQTSEILCLI